MEDDETDLLWLKSHQSYIKREELRNESRWKCLNVMVKMLYFVCLCSCLVFLIVVLVYTDGWEISLNI